MGERRFEAQGVELRLNPLTPRELKRWLDSGSPLELFDVREASERAIACIEGVRLLDESTAAAFEQRDRNTPPNMSQ